MGGGSYIAYTGMHNTTTAKYITSHTFIHAQQQKKEKDKPKDNSHLTHTPLPVHKHTITPTDGVVTPHYYDMMERASPCKSLKVILLKLLVTLAVYGPVTNGCVPASLAGWLEWLAG